MHSATSSWGQHLLDLRRASGHTQVTLAAAVGVSQPTVSRWERGELDPNLEQLRRMAAALGCTVSDLLDEVAA